MISEAIKTNAPLCTVEMWAKQVPGGSGRHIAENFPTKGPFLKGAFLRSGNDADPQECWSSARRQERSCQRRIEPLSWSRVSPGRGEMDAPLQHGEQMVFCQGTQGRDSELSKKPVSAYLCPGIFTVPLPFLIMTSLDKITPSLWNELPSSSPWRVSIWHQWQREHLFSRRKGYRSMIFRVIWKN